MQEEIERTFMEKKRNMMRDIEVEILSRKNSEEVMKKSIQKLLKFQENMKQVKLV